MSETIQGTPEMTQIPRKARRKKSPEEIREKQLLAQLKRMDDNQSTGITPQESFLRNVPDDVASRGLAYSQALYDLPVYDINNVDDVRDGIKQYIQICRAYKMRPGVAGLSMVLGVRRDYLSAIAYDKQGRAEHVPTACRGLVKRAYAMFESNWEAMMQSGGVNPASGIFLGSNNFGYHNVVDHNITPMQPEQVTPDQLQKRLQALPDMD